MGWQSAACPTWLADTGVALPLILADAVGWAGAGVARAGHAAASLHPQGMAGLGQHGPSDAVTQSHPLKHRKKVEEPGKTQNTSLLPSPYKPESRHPSHHPCHRLKAAPAAPPTPKCSEGAHLQQDGHWQQLLAHVSTFPISHHNRSLDKEGSKQWTHLYAAPQPILHLARAEDSTHMQVFHLQAMQFISNNHCVLQNVQRGNMVQLPSHLRV